jgi:penicillin-binding protein 1A
MQSNIRIGIEQIMGLFNTRLKPKKPKRAKGLWWAAAIAGLLCGITSGTLLALTRDLPQIQSLEDFRPSSVTRVYSMDQVLLAELFVEKRDPVSMRQIPDYLITALLTTEDRRFYAHSGMDIKGLLRAALKNLHKGRYAEGASTLTQQLAKTLFLTPRKTLVRKLREAMLALQLERRYTKDEILTLYLNQIYLGSGAYGVAAAARTYFGKEIQELSLSQCALIAGLPRAPSRYSPQINPDLACQRRNTVLAQMRATGAIDEAHYQQARKEPIMPALQENANNKAPYFLDHIKEALENTLGASRLYKGGLTVRTTLSYELQQSAEAGILSGLAQLEARMTSHQMAAPQPQAALVALNVTTGGIVAMVGGRDLHHSGYNRSTIAKRQPGSAFKPIVYALAIQRGFDQHHTLLDAPVVFQSGSRGQDWQPENFSQTYDGEITLRWALVHSKNIPAVRLMEKLGPSSVSQFGHTLGVRSDLQANLSLALGTSEVNLLELTSAYAVFANHGKYIQPFGVTQVVDDTGSVLWQAKPEQHIAMSRSSAAIVTDMLAAVIQEGTGQRARALPGPVAGKTGTTNDTRDALFIGYSPMIAAGVWVGNDDATTLGSGETGARAALPIWIAFMEQAISQKTQHYFDIPDDVHQIHIHPRTGARIAADMPDAVRVLIKQSNEK